MVACQCHFSFGRGRSLYLPCAQQYERPRIPPKWLLPKVLECFGLHILHRIVRNDLLLRTLHSQSKAFLLPRRAPPRCADRTHDCGPGCRGPPPESASVGIVHHHKRRTLCRRFVQTISISARSSKGAPARPTRHGGTHDGDSSGFIRPNPLYCFKRTSESTMIKRFSDDRGRTACRRFLRTYYLAFTDRGVMRGRTVIEPVPQEGLAREPS